MKPKKDKEKHGKYKKHEKHKKTKKSKKKSSSSSTSSKSGSEDEALMTEWVEATQSSNATTKKVETKRDDWMQDESFVPTYSKDVSQSKKMKRKVRSEEEMQREKKILEQRELNPYWKGEGTGLPTSSTTVTQTAQLSSSSSVGDGGYLWLRKAYQRVIEKAEEEGRSVEEVAAERWGSLGKLESMLEDAERRANPGIQTEYRPSISKSKQLDKEKHSSSSREKYIIGHHRSEKDVSPIHYRDRDSKKPDRTMKHCDNSNDSDDAHKFRSSSTRSRDRDTKTSDRSKRHRDSSDDSDHGHSHQSQSSSAHSRDRAWSDRIKRRHNSSEDSDEKRSHKFRSHHESPSREKSHSHNHKLNYHSSKHRKSYGNKYEKDDWHRDSRSSSPKHRTDEKRSEECEERNRAEDSKSRSDSRCHPDEVYAWSRRGSSRQDPNRRDSNLMQKKEEPRRDKERTSYEKGFTHQPSWKKKLPDKNSNLKSKFVGSEDSYADRSEPNDPHNDPLPSASGILKDSPHDSEKSGTVSSADSGSDDETMKKAQKRQDIVMNDNELNYLAARMLRANLWGDSELASRIETDLEADKRRQKEFKESGGQLQGDYPRKEVLDSVVDRYPLPKGFKIASGKKGSKGRTVYLGQTRTKHFDDEKMSLHHMFEREKSTSVDDHLKMFVDAASSRRGVMDEECDEDVSGKTAAKMNKHPDQEKDIQKAMKDYKHLSFALDRCRFCLDKPGLLKHTIVGKVNEVFLCCPSFKSLAEGHCFIVPVTHVSSTLLLEENEYAEVQAFKRGMMKMFGDRGKGMIFMETSIKQRFFPHAVIECVPVPKDTWDMAPLYFKKAIEESEYEWSHNKKLIDLSKKGVRNSVPKGLPFFSVEFGNTGGFAHVIEDDKNFPRRFGREVVGGMLEMDSHEIKEKEESLDEICEKVMKIVNIWWKYEEYFK